MLSRSRRSWVANLAVPVFLAVIALTLGWALHSLAVDDAYITYRFARNLAEGNGFTYNSGCSVLSTTAPLYALILAAGATIWPDVPTLANALSALGLWIAATMLFVLGRREGAAWVGGVAALLLIGYPLLWLSLGLESAAFLALSLAAVAAYRLGRVYTTAALLALATLARGDGLILTAAIGADLALPRLRHLLLRPRGRQVPPGADPARGREPHPRSSWWTALGAAGVYLLVLGPLVAWLTWQFGSPLPVTLRAKVAQSGLGITGFYPGTTFLQGLGILARARFAQTPLYVLFIPALLLGLAALRRRVHWLRLIAVWAVAHIAGYTLLGVTPYYWYYAPLVPALVTTAALGIVEGAARTAARWPRKRTVAYGLAGLWALALVASFAWSDWAMVRALEGPVPSPENPVSKVLPEAKAGPYSQAGQWLHEHTPPGAVVGVTEVGIMGYYARRTMVDFLGLLEPEVSKAVARGDLYWALLRYQPDYLALTAISPLYTYDIRADPWFQAAYQPVHAIEDPRFWGSPVTVYQRTVERVRLAESDSEALPERAIHLGVDLGPIRLLGALTEQGAVQPGDILALTLYWQALPSGSGHDEATLDADYTVFVHLLGQHDRVLAQRDTPPGLGSRPTSQWETGQVVVDPYLIAMPEAAYAPDEAVWEVGLYDPQTGLRLVTADGMDNVRFGSLSVRPVGGPLHLGFGPVTLSEYELDRLALGPGETLVVTLRWTGAEPIIATLQLLDEAGAVAVQASGGLDQALYHLRLRADAVPGAYDLQVVVTDPTTGRTLPLLGTDGQARSDRAHLTKVRVYP